DRQACANMPRMPAFPHGNLARIATPVDRSATERPGGGHPFIIPVLFHSGYGPARKTSRFAAVMYQGTTNQKRSVACKASFAHAGPRRFGKRRLAASTDFADYAHGQTAALSSP